MKAELTLAVIGLVILGIVFGTMIGAAIGKAELINKFCNANKKITLMQQQQCVIRLEEFS